MTIQDLIIENVNLRHEIKLLREQLDNRNRFTLGGFEVILEPCMPSNMLKFVDKKGVVKLTVNNIGKEKTMLIAGTE